MGAHEYSLTFTGRITVVDNDWVRTIVTDPPAPKIPELNQAPAISAWSARQDPNSSHNRGSGGGEGDGGFYPTSHIDGDSLDENRIWSCDECGEIFESANWLDFHALSESHKAFRCGRVGCDEVLFTLTNLRDHVEEHDNGPLQPCGFCDQRIRSRYFNHHLAKAHKVGMGEGKGYHCRHEECPAFQTYRFFTEYAYYQHLRDTHDELLFICDYPGCSRVAKKGFIYKSELYAHQITHIPFTSNFWRDKLESLAPLTSRIGELLALFVAAMGKRKLPSVEKRRIFWNCPSCRIQLFDDFLEIEEGSLDELEWWLNSQPSEGGTCTSQTETMENKAPDTAATEASNVNVFLSSEAGSTSTPQLSEERNTKEAECSVLSLKTSAGHHNSIYLLCCFPRSRYGIFLDQESLDNITNDRSLFEFLRDLSNVRRYNWHLSNPFRSIQGLRLTRFLLSKSGLVDVQSHEYACAKERCICLPPPEKVEPDTRAEYRCQPVPPRYIPPIGENFLMHCFSHPACVDPRQTWVYAQFPKLLSGRLRGEFHTPVEGWGVYFRDGWNWPAIWSALLAFFLLPSFLFLVLWGAFKGDIQGASGVAAYWVTVGTIFMGYVATRN
ncbi:hypothetical protein GQ53DRAFT_814785 [Thozetella sp. PMI_491]|nr:hypothetical protein GQ53DRAFT_814785 [Thozetella sp. PMI_491]